MFGEEGSLRGGSHGRWKRWEAPGKAMRQQKYLAVDWLEIDYEYDYKHY